ncbi:MAG: DsbA family protein [Chthoniobacterales bacterium]
MKRYLPFIIVAVIAVAAVSAGAILYWAKRPHLLSIPEDKAISANPNTEKIHIRGEPDAPVTIEEFGDFECPPCGTMAPYLDERVNEFKPRVRLVFRNFPLPSHKHARVAALAAEAAGLQGKFWEMHDVLYREQSSWSKTDNPHELFSAYAGTIGLNVAEFNKDMESEKVKELVDSDHARGVSLGITMTPTVFINNHELPQDKRNPEGLHGTIDQAVKEASQTKGGQK